MFVHLLNVEMIECLELMHLSEEALQVMLRMPKLERLYFDDLPNQDEVMRLKKLAVSHAEKIKHLRINFHFGVNLQFEEDIMEAYSQLKKLEVLQLENVVLDHR
jgi:hypothetical protein